MKVNVQFWLRAKDGDSFAYGAVSVKGEPTAPKVSAAVNRAFGHLGDTSLHSFGAGSCLNKVGKIGVLIRQ